MKRREFIRRAGAAVTAGTVCGPLASAAEKSQAAGPAMSPPVPRLSPRFGDRRDWWFRKRFGLFVHWGLYAINGYHEQEQWRARVPRARYVKLTERWNPSRFDPDVWLNLAEEAGMSYLCVTTKHHDGFCLWNTEQTSYSTMNTPYGRDILKQIADACHRRAFPLCLYYSIIDWHHPNYPNQGRHHELPPQAGDKPDLQKYLNFVREQVRELCTRYGEIHGFWWDMNMDQTVDPSFNAMIRQLQPSAVINDRGFDPGDFGTPERDEIVGDDVQHAFLKRTEACQSVGMESWGFRRNEDHYSDRHLLRGIDTYLARDSNYLLNVGPSADGSIPTDSATILRRIGLWYRLVRESLEGVVPASHLTSNRAVLITQRDTTLYVHLLGELAGDVVKLPPLSVSPMRATLLNNGENVEHSVEVTPSDYEHQRGFLRLRKLPVNLLANSVLVVKLEFSHRSYFEPGETPQAEVSVP